MKKGFTTLFFLAFIVANIFAQPFTCVNWVNMADEPDYGSVPYDKPTYTAIPAPKDWKFDANTLDFEAAWNAAGVEALISKGTNVAGGDLFDIGTGNTYGASWKATYDSENLYVFIKWVGADKSEEGYLNMEIMFQPTSIDRYEPDFEAAAGDPILQNHSYARYLELGGGKAVFKEGMVTAVDATMGSTATWSSNEHALTELALATHYWNLNGSTVNAVMVMPISALATPDGPPFDDLSYRTDLTIVPGQTKISWDMKANARVGGTENANKVEYCWSSTGNNVYAVNYYAGYILFGAGTTGINNKIENDINIFYSNNKISIKGIESANVKVYNVNGKMVGSYNNTSNGIDVSDLSNGVYFVSLKNVNKTFKIVKY